MNLPEAAEAQGDAALERAVRDVGIAARKAAGLMAQAPAESRTAALLSAAGAIRAAAPAILAANEQDMAAAKRAGLSPAMLDRLKLDPGRIEAMAAGIETVAALPDPLNRTLAEWTRPNGLSIARISVPLGVIAIIYESRPNVTADAAALCLRAGNASILRGGSESERSSATVAATK